MTHFICIFLVSTSHKANLSFLHLSKEKKNIFIFYGSVKLTCLDTLDNHLEGHK